MRRHFHAAAFVGIFLAALPLTLQAGDTLIKIDGIPHIRQKPDFCGEACIAMWLRKLGHDTTQEQVFSASGTDPVLGRGMVTREMLATLASMKFVKPDACGWIDAADAEGALNKAWEAALDDLKAGVPSIVCMRYDERPETTEHFRLIVGYDPDAGEVLYHEPAEADGAYRRMKKDAFLSLWPLKYKEKSWLLVRMRLQSGETLSLPEAKKGYTPADFCQVVMEVKPRLPEGFTIMVQPPFVVIGDESADRVRSRAVRTVRWCSDRLKELYFAKEPASIYTVWLFKDKKSYEKHTKLFFNYTPSTPFGYASESEKALVMNIATGGGTLCHEIVHAYVDANFPDCPSWFNEGLASLYEQCGERDGRIVGFTNWRLAGLQKAIRAKRLPKFSELCGTTSHEFYNMDKGDNYAQARYLCYYLQEKDLLVKYYNAFVNHADEDPTGYATLKSILGEADIDGFQDRWEEWVLNLRFRR